MNGEVLHFFLKRKEHKKMNNPYSQNSEIPIEKLIEGNLDVVKKIAWQIHGRVHNVIEIEDLIQQGMEGLVHAAQKYSPRENVTFPQYAQLRIRGSIIDYLRKNSNLCRTTIKKKSFSLECINNKTNFSFWFKNFYSNKTTYCIWRND